MGGASVRASFTSRGSHSFCPWNDSRYNYSVGQLLIGSNPISKLEVVSALNSFNLAIYQYHFNYTACPARYNPKVYLSAIQ
ncbi:MAG TPA: hypothetical protein DCY93_03320, partial [Firmicutes bacterium]|nr:hypothetical protein [Bacillota bacterium]